MGEWFFIVPPEAVVEKKKGPGSGWWAPPKGTHTAGAEGKAARKPSRLSLPELKAGIKRERRYVEEDRPGNPYEKYRSLQKKLAINLLPKSGKLHLMVDRGTLALLNKRDFPENTIIGVGKYRIHIKGKRRQHTTVFTTQGLADLRRGQMPAYISRFVF